MTTFFQNMHAILLLCKTDMKKTLDICVQLRGVEELDELYIYKRKSSALDKFHFATHLQLSSSDVEERGPSQSLELKCVFFICHFKRLLAF